MRIFRAIRQKLLTENKFTKYLLYAVGETVLVVIGILIALQINNWNEAQKAQKHELLILENILQDLKDDKTGLNKIIDRRTSKVSSAETMVSYYEGVKIAKLSDYYFHWANVAYWDTHNPRNVAFKELVNSGNVSIIKNADIRKKLLDINASYEELFAVRQHMYEDYVAYLYNPYAAIIDYGDALELWSNPELEIELSEADVEIALKNKVIKNGFTLATFNNILLKNQLLMILENVELAIDLIEEEIEMN